MRWSICISLLLVLFAGCQSEDPANIASPEATMEPDREAAAFTFGSVTLNGTVTTDPGYKNAPFSVAIKDTQANYIILGKLTPQAIPAVTHPVIARMQGPLQGYGGSIFSTTGLAQYWPVMIDQTDAVTLQLNNGMVRAYAEACKWTWDIRTRSVEDTHEPDDDDTAATYTDRTMGRSLQADRSSPWSLFTRDATRRDVEEWYRFDTGAALSIKVDLTTTDGTWGDWTYSLRVVNQSGQIVKQWLNFRGGTQSVTFPSTGTGAQRYYLQLTGTPLRKDRGNVDWLSGTIKVSTITEPQWASHKVTGGNFFGSIGNVMPFVINSRPLIIFTDTHTPDPYLRVAKAKVPVPMSAADWDVYDMGITNFYSDTLSTVVHNNRIAIAYKDAGEGWPPGPMQLLRQITTDPDGPEDWAVSTIREDEIGSSLVACATGYAIYHPGNAFEDDVLVSSSFAPTGPADWSQVIELPENRGTVPLHVFEDRLTVIYRDYAPLGGPENIIFMRATTTDPFGTYVSHDALIDPDPWRIDITIRLCQSGGRIGMLYTESLFVSSPCTAGGGQETTDIPRMVVSKVAEPQSSSDWQTVMVFQGITTCDNFLSAPQVAMVDGRAFLIEDSGYFNAMHRAPSSNPAFTPYDTRALPAGVFDGFSVAPFDLNGHITVAHADWYGVYFVTETAGW